MVGPTASRLSVYLNVFRGITDYVKVPIMAFGGGCF